MTSRTYEAHGYRVFDVLKTVAETSVVRVYSEYDDFKVALANLRQDTTKGFGIEEASDRFREVVEKHRTETLTAADKALTELQSGCTRVARMCLSSSGVCIPFQ